MLNTKYPIIAAAMNQVSDLNLAVACHSAGIMPSISFLNYIDKSTGFCDIEKFEQDILKFKEITNSSNLIISISSKTLLIGAMSERLSAFLNSLEIAYLEIIITESLELTSNQLSENDKNFFIKLKNKLSLFSQHKIYKSIDKFSAISIRENFGKDIFQLFSLKSNQGAGIVTQRKNADIITDIKEFKDLFPDTYVIASGGISSKKDIDEYFNAGASAVAIGTLFAASEESNLSITAKNKIVESTVDSITKIKNNPQNAIVFSEIEKDDYNNTLSLKTGIETGTTGHLFVGRAIEKIDSIKPVKEIVQMLTKKHNFNLESFCPEAWSQIEIDAQGDYKICCLANFDKDFGMALDKDGNTMNVLTHSINEAINSETHKKHRLDMAANIKPSRCRNCFDSEEATKGLPEWKEKSKFGVSKRQRVIHQTARKNPEYANVDSAELITNLDGSIDSPKVVNLDLRFGNLCNQKCIMCSPQHSNQWYDDWLAIGYGDPEYNRDKEKYKKGIAKEYPLYVDQYGKARMQGANNWWESPDWWNTFSDMAPDLRHIYFTGGEPLVVPAMQECLDILIEGNYAKNIELRYDTNLSVINKKVIDKWKNFKNINLCVSVDDTWDRYNLIRHPGNFEKIHNNIAWLKEANIPIHYISTCVGIASPYSVIRISDYAKEYNLVTNFRFLEGPNWLDIRNLPKAAKLEIITNLENHNGDDQYKKWAKAQIRLLEKYIDHYNERHLQEFVRIMDILDSRRGTNWRETLNDVLEIFQKYCPNIKV